MNCENCDKEFEPKRSTARYCSPKCRKLAFRALKDMQDGNAKVDANLKGKELDLTKPLTCEGQGWKPKPSLEHYQEYPDHYALRTAPEKLNWGLYLDAVALKARGFVANRVSIPGDWDYEGAFA